MLGSLGMKLVFRLGGAGFALPVSDLIEVNEIAVAALEVPSTQEDPDLLGLFPHRGSLMPVRDLGGRLDLPRAIFPGGQITLLVLPGGDAPWGLAAERVEGVFPYESFRPISVSEWIFSGRMWPFAQIVLWQDEPLLQCEALALERVWGGQ